MYLVLTDLKSYTYGDTALTVARYDIINNDDRLSHGSTPTINDSINLSEHRSIQNKDLSIYKMIFIHLISCKSKC